MMDISVLFQLSYGLYAIGTSDKGRPTGCIANTAFQITSSPFTLAVSLNKNNYTNEVIKKEGRFCVSILSEKVPPLVITYLGFQSGRDRDKFKNLSYRKTAFDLPYLLDGCCGMIECEVVQYLDIETHTIFIARITDTASLSNEKSMTYSYYHNVLKGKVPKNAPLYIEEPAKTES